MVVNNCFRVLGAKCMLTCMSSGDTIPPGDSPIFTEGMRGLIICFTGFDVDTKKRLQEKVEFMGGVYHATLRSVITHVVAYNNISVKAIEAYNSKIPIMREEWVEAVWNRSLDANVRGSDNEFAKYRSPLFHNLKITTSGISKRRKEELKQLITENGGLFTGQLEMNLTNILIVDASGGDKYDAAVSWKIPCIKTSWLRKCVEANRIVPFRDYSVDKKQTKASTPKKGDTVNFTGNFSAISVIEPENFTHLDESTNITTSQVFSVPFSKPDPLQEKVEKIAKEAIHAGQFLDGCNVYLSGFSQNLAEKLRKVLNVGGATRFDDLNTAVTHIVVPRLCGESLKETTAYILPIEWLLASVELKKPAPVEEYLLNNSAASNSAPPSPLSKQSARLLSRPDPKNLQQEFEMPEDVPEPPSDDDLAHRYQQSQHGEPISQRLVRSQVSVNRSSASSLKSDLTQTNSELFCGLRFFLSSKLEAEELKQCEQLVLKHNGKVVSKRFAGIPNYAVVPIDGDSLTDSTPLEVVNLFFIQECIQQNEIVALQYYHHPFSFAGSTPLNGCVICISQYVGCEKDFIESACEKLGAVVQSVMARKKTRGNLKTTHLVCLEPSGMKYDGAIRWGVPVVYHDWLFKCAELGTKVSEEAFLLPGSKMPSTSNKSLPSSASKSAEVSNVIETPMASKVTQSMGSKLRELNAQKTWGSQLSEAKTVAAESTNTPIEQAPLLPEPITESVEINRVSPSSEPRTSNRKTGRKLFDSSVKRSPIVEKPSLSVTVQASAKPQSSTPEIVKLPLDLSGPVTPALHKVCENLRNTPQLSQSPDMNRTMTPMSPYGACFGVDNPSPRTRKRLNKWIDQGANLPVETPTKRFASQQRRDSTPLSSLLSKQLNSMMRRPEEQPPDDSPLSRNVSQQGRQIIENDVINGLQRMREIEESYTRTSSVPSPATVTEEPKVMIVAESQPHTEVGWDDPTDRDIAIVSLEKELPRSDKIFMFTGLPDSLETAKLLIANSRGILSQLSHFDKSATHLIAGETMTRAEKLLGSIAAGLWVLHPRYLKQLAVVKDVNALKEEDYEWGNPNISMPLDALTPNVRDCVVNACYWRCEIEKSVTNRPFWGMRFILLISSSKRDVFARLLDAGGGEITTVDRVESNKKNFCICELSAPPLKADMETFAKKGIFCVTTMFISDVILRKPTAIQENMVLGFAECWDRYN